MEIVKETEEYQIIKKRSGRYGIRKTDRSWIGGDEKVTILVAEGLLKVAAPKEEAPAEEPPAEAAATSEETSEEASGAEEASE
jgi:hypothetical protein